MSVRPRSSVHIPSPRLPQEDGAITLLAAAIIGLLGIIGIGIVKIGGAALDRARAQTAADAAALAGVAEGRSAAEDYAQRNGGVVTNWVDEVDEVQVTVEVFDARATARARRVRTPAFAPIPAAPSNRTP